MIVLRQSTNVLSWQPTNGLQKAALVKDPKESKMFRHKHFIPIVLAIATLVVFPAAIGARKAQRLPAQPDFDREQFMLMNLNRGQDSTGFYLSGSHAKTKVMVKDLDKALRQLEQVDRTYAKSRGKPDDRFLDSTYQRIKQAKQTAEQLEVQLKDAYDDLKVSIQQTLVLEN
ncbi:MAG: hypothetical protein HY711_06005 [Candidatus Melainabacteria bacterium]|nr:hypothetical protein [Candidatus Melainabacteria bacterium]